MTLEEILDEDVSVRKIVWSKRGDKLTRQKVDQNAEFDIQPRTRIEVKDKSEKK